MSDIGGLTVAGGTVSLMLGAFIAMLRRQRDTDRRRDELTYILLAERRRLADALEQSRQALRRDYLLEEIARLSEELAAITGESSSYREALPGSAPSSSSPPSPSSS